MRLVRIAELAIDFVGNEEEVMLLAEFAYHKHFVLSEKLAGRIAGIADENGLGPRCVKGLESLDPGHLEAVLDFGVNRLEGDAVEEGESLIVSVERLYDDDLVTFVGSYLHGNCESFASSYVDQQLVYCDVYANLLIILFDHTLAEFHESGRVGVGEVMHPGALVDDSLECHVRALDVGSTHVEMIDFDA